MLGCCLVCGMIDIKNIFKESLEIFILKRKSILRISGVFVLILVLLWIGFEFAYRFSFDFVYYIDIVYFIVTSLFFLVVYIGIIYALKDDIGMRASYKKGFKMFFPYLLVYVLSAIFVLGGNVLFLVPGLFFYIVFLFVGYVFVFEDKRGMSALSQSYVYIRKRFWDVFKMYIAWSVVSTVLALGIPFVLSFWIGNEAVLNITRDFLYYLFYLFVLPFEVILFFVVYKKIQETSQDLDKDSHGNGFFKRPFFVVSFSVGVFAFLVYSFVLVLNVYYGRDIPPVDDAYLTVSSVTVPDAKNAYFPFQKAVEKMKVPQNGDEKRSLFENMSEGAEWDEKFAINIVNENADVFPYIDEGLSMPYFQIPQYANPDSENFTKDVKFSEYSDLFRLQRIKARYLASQDRYSQALDEVVKTIDGGYKIMNSPVIGMIGYIYGRGVFRDGFSLLSDMINSSDVPYLSYEKYIQIADKYNTKMYDNIDKVMKTEYTLNKKMNSFYFDFFAEQNSSIFADFHTKLFAYLYKPNQTVKKIADGYSMAIEELSKKCVQRKRDIESDEYEVNSFFKTFFTDNYFGNTTAGLNIVEYSANDRELCNLEFQIDKLRVISAIKAYREKTGEKPKDLKQLIPDYLSSLPVNPYTGENLEYSFDDGMIFAEETVDGKDDLYKDFVIKIN